MDLVNAAEMTGVLIGGGSAALTGRIVWDWLRNNRASTVPPPATIPKASNGFITQAYLGNHCDKVQVACTKMIEATIRAEVGPIVTQLVAGGDIMTQTQQVLNRHERILDELRGK